LYEFDLAGTQATEIIRLPNLLMGYDWSPDGALLAYQLRSDTSTEIGPAHLCLFDSRDGSAAMVRLLSPPFGTGTGQREETLIRWSSNGDSILLVDTAEEPTIRVVDPQGTDRVEPQSGTFARWLSDDEILYQTVPHTDLVAGWVSLQLSATSTEVVGLPRRAYRPAVSPDGRTIAFDNGDGFHPTVYLFDTEHNTLRRVLRGYLAPLWLGEHLLAATAAEQCSGEGCPIPWALLDRTVGIDISSGTQSRLTLPTTMNEYQRNGTIDVDLTTSAP
jgi:Tol biopolymer transport system component